MPITVASVTLGNLASSGTSITMNYPATVNSGDLLIAYVAQKGAAGSGSDTFTTPSGYTSRASGSSEWNAQYACFTRTADGTEDGGTFTITTSRDTGGGITARGIVIRITDHGGYDNVAGAAVGVATGGAFSSPTLTPTQNNCLVLSILGATWDNSAGGLTQPAGYTEAYDGGGSTFHWNFGVAHITQTTAAATGALSWSGIPTNYPSTAVTLSVAPAASGGHTKLSGKLGYPLRGKLG